MPGPISKRRHQANSVSDSTLATPGQVDAYLARISYRGALEPCAATLRALHRAHVYSVPFENLDIILGRPIMLSVPQFHDKIVGRRRGGFCYELNGLFAWLLGELGFDVALLSGRVCQDGMPGEAFDHLALLVSCDERLLVDVGFGDLFEEPLRIDSEADQRQGDCAYRVTADPAGRRVVWRRRPGADWEAKYDVELIPRRLDDFSARCQELQTSPESIFTRNSVCTLPVPAGRVTLAGNRLIVTKEARREERSIRDESELREVLENCFGLPLDVNSPIASLLTPDGVDEVLRLVE